jgi:hypothetical protein
LNGLGLRTQQGSPWTPHNVCEKQVNLGIPSRRQRARKALTTARPHRTEPTASQPDDVVGATD